MAYLLLFDINGVLGSKDKRKASHFVFRPAILDILTTLADQYTIGIYSSTTTLNVEKILAMISPTWRNLFLVVADRTVTSLDPDYGIDPIVKSYDTVKKLSNFWEHPVLNPKRQWHSKNTLLIEHDPKKCRFNDPSNVLIIPEYHSKAIEPFDFIGVINEKIEFLK